MKKVLVLGTLLASLSISSVFGAGSDIRVFLNNDYIDFPDAKPIIRNDRTTVPVAIIARNLGIDYTWEGATRTVSFEQDGKELDLRIGEHNSFIEQSRTYVPLRYIAESFNQEVDWRADVRTVVIGDDAKNIQLPQPTSSIKDVTEFTKEPLTNYVPEGKGIIEYRVGNEYERSKYVYKIQTSDLPVKIDDFILHSIEPEIEIVGTGKNPTFVVHQTIPNDLNFGLYLNVTDKNFKTVRPRNNYHTWTRPKKTDKFGNDISKTFYGVIVLDRHEDWKTYNADDAYYFIFNSKKVDYAVIVENPLNK